MHGRANAEDPEILVRLVTQDVAALKHFLKTNPVEVVRVLLPDDGYPAWAAILTSESVAARARSAAEMEVVVLARPPKTDREIPKVGKGNRFADPKVLPRGRGKIVR